MTDIRTVFIDSGIEGVEIQYKKDIKENNRNWFYKFLLCTIVFTGFWCSKPTLTEQMQQRAQFISDSTNASTIKALCVNDSLYKDSTEKYYSEPFVSDTISDSKISKMRSDIVKKHKR